MEIKVLDLALAVIAIVMIIVGYQIARLGSHVRDSLSRLDRMIEHVNQIAPRIDRVVENANRELETLHSVSRVSS
jgi:predicted PurR-regulated permease PerM